MPIINCRMPLLHTGVWFFLLLLSLPLAASRFADWFPPFNESRKIYELCNNEMDKIILLHSDHEKVQFYMEKYVICYDDFHVYVSPKFVPLVWFMRALRFCEINQIIDARKSGIDYNRRFQKDFLRYAYAMLCDKIHLLPQREHYKLSVFSDIMEILYKQEAPDRDHICNKISNTYGDLYARCFVPHVDKRQQKIRDRCSGFSTPIVKFPAFFQRFSRECSSLDEFLQRNPTAYNHVGNALSDDIVFMNLLSSNLVTNINSDSELPSLVLKTRLMLQHFSLAAVKLWRQLNSIRKCRQQIRKELELERVETSGNETVYENKAGKLARLASHKCCVYSNSYICDIPNERKYRDLSDRAFRCFSVEGVLLCLVALHTVLLTLLLAQTSRHLSTATVLFVFNIVFSNILFLCSFAILYSDFFDETPYGPVNEDYANKSPELIVAETLQTHLFASTEFQKHLVQETLYSLAQNGSLIGLIHLLVLVLVVINRSMSGKSIHLSKAQVVSVFACVWVFLIGSHILFSTLQISAIQNLDNLFATLAKGRNYLQCNVSISSDYTEIAGHCDRTAIFHTFGAYLLRGHTLFTALFLIASVLIFTITISYHIRVRRQHDFLHHGMRLSESGSSISQPDTSPHRRREMLFHTLLLSIGAFFISVIGQTYIEIAVFWMEDRENLVSLTKWYHIARIIAFVDPVFNPLIVIIRTPALRRQVRSRWSEMRSRESSRRGGRLGVRAPRRASSMGDRARHPDMTVRMVKVKGRPVSCPSIDIPLNRNKVSRSSEQRAETDSNTNNSIV